MKIETHLSILYGLAILAIILSVITAFTQPPKTEYDFDDLSEGVGIQFCSASVNSEMILCEDNNGFSIAHPLYNTTIERLEKVLNNCKKPVIDVYHECIGERFTIYKNADGSLKVEGKPTIGGR